MDNLHRSNQMLLLGSSHTLVNVVSKRNITLEEKVQEIIDHTPFHDDWAPIANGLSVTGSTPKEIITNWITKDPEYNLFDLIKLLADQKNPLGLWVARTLYQKFSFSELSAHPKSKDSQHYYDSNKHGGFDKIIANSKTQVKREAALCRKKKPCGDKNIYDRSIHIQQHEHYAATPLQSTIQLSIEVPVQQPSVDAHPKRPNSLSFSKYNPKQHERSGKIRPTNRCTLTRMGPYDRRQDPSTSTSAPRSVHNRVSVIQQAPPIRMSVIQHAPRTRTIPSNASIVEERKDHPPHGLSWKKHVLDQCHHTLVHSINPELWYDFAQVFMNHEELKTFEQAVLEEPIQVKMQQACKILCDKKDIEIKAISQYLATLREHCSHNSVYLYNIDCTITAIKQLFLELINHMKCSSSDLI